MGRDPIRHGYRKGDNTAGGGGTSGGGGKRGRSPHGWEKGDHLRDFAEVREDVELPRKPGSPHYPPRAAAPAEPTTPVGPTIVQALRAVQASVLTTLRKLEGTSTADAARRASLRTEAAQALARKQAAEQQLFPLLADDPGAAEGIAAATELQPAVDDALDRLLATAPTDRDFALAVRVLHGTLEQQIDVERDDVLGVAERVVPTDQAVDLARRLAEND
jgi:hypothetical protein